LKNLASQFTKYGIFAGIGILVILIIMTIVVVGTVPAKTDDGSKPPSTAGLVFAALPKHINLVVVLIVVAIPEGLPITI